LHAQGFAGANQVFLPGKLFERAWAHPLSQRSIA
jgi:hypothetical protein